MTHCKVCPMNKQIGEIYIHELLGSEVEEFCQQVNTKDMTCTCGEVGRMNMLRGYPHDGGLIDSEGRRWWVYYHCPKCHYEWSHTKILRRIKDGLIK